MRITFASIAVFLLLGLHPSLGGDATFLQKLKRDPLGSPQAARWFASLPLAKQKEYAARIGQIVLEASKGTKDECFVVAFGADKAPYPWALLVGGKGRLELKGGNSFYYVRRDDQWVKSQWGVWWVIKQSYRTKVTSAAVTFHERNEKGRGSDLWIPATGWAYVGPKLTKSDWVLGHDHPPDE